ncbi:MAG: TolC family protein [Fimbriimonadaceae bacterium]|nr:TolC family protein [Fimbriimonadaceae bacterium]QYK56059.1 MAG: TolC family protein [Fimbriimonadaceae bacterium]
MNSQRLAAAWLLLAPALAGAQSLTLDDALRAARSNQTALQAAELAIERARATARSLGAYPATRVGLGLSSPSDLGPTDEDLFLEQPIDVFGRAAGQKRLGQARVKEAEADYRHALLNLQAEVVELFARAKAARDLATAARSLEALAEQILAATERRVEGGDLPQVQATRARIEHGRAHQEARARTSEYEAALRRLAAAIGAAQVEAVEGTIELPSTRDADLAQRPDLEKVQARIQVAGAERRAAQLSRLPEVSALAFRSPWSDGRGEVGGRLQATWTLWDDGRSRAQEDSAKAERAALKSEYDVNLRRAEAEHAAVELEATTARGQVEALAGLIDQNRALVETIQRGLDNGIGTLTDVLEATRSLRELEQAAIEARLRLELAEAARLRTTGVVLEALR